MTTLNARAQKLADAMSADADQLGISVDTLPCGTRVIDCGVNAKGSVEAGRRLAEVCLAGLAYVEILPEKRVPSSNPNWFDPSGLFPNLNTKYVFVTSEQPVAACMASQYAGWEIKVDDYFAMGSGPMRAAAHREELFDDIGYAEEVEACVGVLEASKLPPEHVCLDLAEKCGIRPDRLTLLVARTASPAGTVQIVARSLETALHKLHVLGFDLRTIKDGFGVAPLPPVAENDLQAIGWTNDAILYGGWVGITLAMDEGAIEKFGPRVPSSASPDYGQPFADIFKRYGGDFYKIDPMLFSPAMIDISVATQAGSHVFGKVSSDVLLKSFGPAQ
jgi:methenyltetrahydromethanopterin cyclohydrolase